MIKETIVELTTEKDNQNLWDNIGGSYVKLEKDKAKVLMLIDWKLEKVKKFKDEKGDLREQIEFSASVLSEDGKPVNNKIFTTTSINALKGLREILSNKDSKKPVLLRIKKIGEGKSTIYDIEEQEIQK